MSLEIDVDIDVDSTKDFNKNNTLIAIMCFVLDFDNSDNILKVFGESLAEDLNEVWWVDGVIDFIKRWFDSDSDKMPSKIDASIALKVFDKVGALIAKGVDDIISSSYFYIRFIAFYKYLILYQMLYLGL